MSVHVAMNGIEGVERRCRAAAADDPDPSRREGYDSRFVVAAELVPRLPLIHRTGKKNGRSWPEILRDGWISASPAESGHEQDVWDGKVCTFLGTATYPEGARVAFVFAQTAIEPTDTATPFDTGGLAAFTRLAVSSTALGTDAARTKLGEWIVGADGVRGLATHHLAASFRDVGDYCRRPQHSETDWVPPHGLVSAGMDRRAWNVELQHHRNLPIRGEPGCERIAVDSRQLERAIQRQFPADGARVQFLEGVDYLEEPEAEQSFVTRLGEVRLG